MTQAVIEHVNVTVSDIQRSAQMLCTLFGWNIRWQGPAALGGQTMHVGSGNSYIAVYQSADTAGNPSEHAKGQPLNHIGILVDDLEETERLVIDYGLKPFSHGSYDPGRRFYFFDWDGIEFEIISYSSSTAT